MDTSGFPESQRVDARPDSAKDVNQIDLLLDAMAREYRPYTSGVTYPSLRQRNTPLAHQAGANDIRQIPPAPPMPSYEEMVGTFSQQQQSPPSLWERLFGK